MIKTLQVIIFLSLALLSLGTAPSLLAKEPNRKLTLQWALDNPQELTPDVLKDPSNVDLLENLKEDALNTHSKNAVLPLLRLGDLDVMRDCISLYHKRITKYYSDYALAESGNPDVIPFIGDDLNKSESGSHYEIRGDLLVAPLSVRTAEIIKKILLTSSTFSPAVRDWSKNLPGTLTSDQLRQVFRNWWNQNRVLMLAKKYAEVQPPR